jgi:hypothetical protein
MRVLVCGGRAYDDIERLYGVLDRLHARTPITCIIEGGATGADYLAYRWSAMRHLDQHAKFKADWTLHGKSAGPKRNQKMIDEGKPDLVVAFPGGRGTADMIRRAKAAGITVHEIAP